MKTLILCLLLSLPLLTTAQSPFKMGISGSGLLSTGKVTGPIKNLKPLLKEGYGFSFGVIGEYKITDRLYIRLHPSLVTQSSKLSVDTTGIKLDETPKLDQLQLAIPLGAFVKLGRIDVGLSARYSHVLNERNNLKGLDAKLLEKKNWAIQGNLEYRVSKHLSIGVHAVQPITPLMEWSSRDNTGKETGKFREYHNLWQAHFIYRL